MSYRTIVDHGIADGKTKTISSRGSRYLKMVLLEELTKQTYTPFGATDAIYQLENNRIKNKAKKIEKAKQLTEV